MKHGGEILAISVVSSGGYDDDLDNSDSLTYIGQGGNVMNTDKEPEDQKLEWGNLALKNSMHKKNPVGYSVALSLQMEKHISMMGYIWWRNIGSIWGHMVS
jgi:hypothetical protein